MSFVQRPSTAGHRSVRQCVGLGSDRGRIMCIRDRNLSLTSHRQLSTYSFEVYLVLLPRSPLAVPRNKATRPWAGGGAGTWAGPCWPGQLGCPLPTSSTDGMTRRLNVSDFSLFFPLVWDDAVDTDM